MKISGMLWSECIEFALFDRLSSCVLCYSAVLCSIDQPNVLGDKTVFNFIVRLKVVDLFPSNAVCYYFYLCLSPCCQGFSDEHITSQSS